MRGMPPEISVEIIFAQQVQPNRYNPTGTKGGQQLTYRIAIAGFQHETNTFSAAKAGLEQFEMADSWPGLLRGDDVAPGLAGMNIPLAGFIHAAQQSNDIDLATILWCAAEPSGHVTDRAFDTITAHLMAGLADAAPFDAIYLDLHGAMVTTRYDDGEGELLRRIRAVYGADLPIVISLDLHANISPAMVTHTDAMTIFRTYPHLDMAQAGARAYRLLSRILAGWHPAKALRQVPLLVPLNAQFTGADGVDTPAARLYDAISAHDVDDAMPMDIALGFTAADTQYTGGAVVAYADDQALADAAAARIHDVFMALAPSFDTTLLSPQDGVMKAMGFLGQGPQVIADVQDNAGAGGSSDTTGLLRAMLDAGVTAGVLGIIADPLLAAQCHDVGVGGTVIGQMGGQMSAHLDDAPYEGLFKVLALSDGAIPATGAMYGGSTAQLGLSALVRVVHDRAEVDVVVSSDRIQCLDQAFFRHFGVDLETRTVIAVKSTVHYRADFDLLCPRPINIAAPGLFSCVLDDILYQNLRDGIHKL